MERASGAARALEVAGRRAVVVGAARSGTAAARFLAARGARVVLTDLRYDIADGASLEAAGIELELGRHRRETFERAELVVLSPGVPPALPEVEAARRAGAVVIGELELASRWIDGPIVAVTGTKGKSTTTTLIGQMLREAGLPVVVGGNIGVALSTEIDESTPHVWHVIEASSFQLEMTETFRPHLAVFLNLSPDHLDRHASLEDYTAAKARIFANQEGDDWALVNADDPAVVDLVRQTRAQVARFSMHDVHPPGVAVEGGAITWRDVDGAKVALAPLGAVKLIGRHLAADAVAAAGAAHLCGVPAEAITRALEGFSGLEHALERVAEIGGVQFVNDSKATNIDAARLAIESFDGGVVAIMGGRFKGGDLTALRPAMHGRVDAIVAIGEARPLLREALAPVVPVHDASSMRNAVERAVALAAPGGTVLLAPACASFDMFTDYAARGRAFKDEVERLRRVDRE